MSENKCEKLMNEGMSKKYNDIDTSLSLSNASNLNLNENTNEYHLSDRHNGITTGITNNSCKKNNIVFDLLIPIILGILLYVLFSMFFIVSTVNQTSMIPNLNEGDIVMSLRNSPIQSYKRGDIIIFKYNSKILVKRIIALPGEHIVISGGKVYVNGEVLNEEYISSVDEVSYMDSTVPVDEYFCMGDNRMYSVDSRAFGTINKNEILGKVLLRFFPNFRSF